MVSHHAAAGTKTFCAPQSALSTISCRKSTASSRVLSLLAVVVLFVSLSVPAAAIPHGDRRASPSANPAIRVDSSFVLGSQPLPPLMPPARDGDATRTASAPPSKRSLDVDPKTGGGDFQIPKPFDMGLPNNFTSGCADFLNRMLKSDTINTCHPFSLLLLTSTGLFEASKTKIRITQTLEATCAANSTQCLGNMNNLSRELLTSSACKTDYDSNNPQVVQAYNGLIAYEPLYRASCLKDNNSSYCYANAVTNTTNNGEDAYPYSLPVGVTLGGGARPTCNSCLQDTMAIFSTFAGNSTQPLSQTYSSAAQQITIYCGASFVNVTAAPLKGAAPTTTSPLTPPITLLLMLLFYLFQ